MDAQSATCVLRKDSGPNGVIIAGTRRSDLCLLKVAVSATDHCYQNSNMQQLILRVSSLPFDNKQRPEGLRPIKKLSLTFQGTRS